MDSIFCGQVPYLRRGKLIMVCDYEAQESCLKYLFIWRVNYIYPVQSRPALLFIIFPKCLTKTFFNTKIDYYNIWYIKLFGLFSIENWIEFVTYYNIVNNMISAATGASTLPRDLIQWLDKLDLSYSVRNPKMDLSNGFIVA